MSLSKEQRDRAISYHSGDERLLVFSEKFRNGRQGLHKDLRHFVALEITRRQDKCADTRIHQCLSFEISISDAVVFSQNDPAVTPDSG